jgi:hypothetical protein
MAWSPEKTELLRRLVGERLRLESSPNRYIKYGLARTVLQIIGSHCDDATRQAILNDLIDDKVAMLEVDKAEIQAQANSADTDTTTLNSMKE